MAGKTGVTDSIFEAFVLAVRDTYRKDDFSPDIRDDAWKIGRLKGMGQAAAPSVKFHRPGGSLQPTGRNGPHRFERADGSAIYFSSVYEDLATVEVRIHAQNWEQMECIWTAIIKAARDTLGTYSIPGSYDHVSEGDDDPMPEFVKGNQLLVQSFQWTILMPHVVGTLSQIEKVLGSNQFIDFNPAPGSPGPDTCQPLAAEFTPAIEIVSGGVTVKSNGVTLIA